jgi:hypothetical protein
VPFQSHLNPAGTLRVSQWEVVWGYVRNGIDSFDYEAEHPIDRFQAKLTEYVPDARDLPKPTVALLISEWIRTHPVVEGDVKIGTRIRLTEDARAYQGVRHPAGTTVEVIECSTAHLVACVVVDDDTLDSERWWLPLEGERRGWEPLHPDLDSVPEPFLPEESDVVRDLRAKLAAAEAAVLEVKTAHYADMARVSEVFMKQANARGWCNEYDEIVLDEVNPHLTVPMDVRDSDWLVPVAATFTIPLLVQVTSPTASRAEEDAQTLVEDMGLSEVLELYRDHGTSISQDDVSCGNARLDD